MGPRCFVRNKKPGVPGGTPGASRCSRPLPTRKQLESCWVECWGATRTVAARRAVREPYALASGGGKNPTPAPTAQIGGHTLCQAMVGRGQTILAREFKAWVRVATHQPTSAGCPVATRPPPTLSKSNSLVGSPAGRFSCWEGGTFARPQASESSGTGEFLGWMHVRVDVCGTLDVEHESRMTNDAQYIEKWPNDEIWSFGFLSSLEQSLHK